MTLSQVSNRALKDGNKRNVDMGTQHEYHCKGHSKMNFGTRIRELRKDQNLTLRELAGDVGIDFTYLSKIETGKGVPPAEETIRRLAVRLNTQPEELILLADKLPVEFERDLLDRPETQIAGLYRTMAGKTYSDDAWREVLKILQEQGETN